MLLAKLGKINTLSFIKNLILTDIFFRSNFMGTEFHLYDTGSNPKKALSFESVRKELAVITYETNFFGAKGPRKMKALIPDMKEDGDGFYEWKPTKVRANNDLILILSKRLMMVFCIISKVEKEKVLSIYLTSLPNGMKV